MQAVVSPSPSKAIAVVETVLKLNEETAKVRTFTLAREAIASAVKAKVDI